MCTLSGRAVRPAIAALALIWLAAPAVAQTSFVAPPRSIGDITSVVDNEKPDAARAARNRAEADANPPAAGDASTLAQFYFRRAQSRAQTGRNKEAIADAEKAVSLGGDFITQVSRYQQFLSGQ